jgi:[ribosomal protein S18]-alanine N-acetyltransferase
MNLEAATVLEIVRLRRAHVSALASMLAAVRQDDSARHFAPHPFDADHLTGLCGEGEMDLYYLLRTNDDVLGYGLLRGWAEGFDVPSLGIAIHPAHRGAGHATALMGFLHSAALLRKAPRVRLRVDGANERAIALYRRLGYQFEPAQSGDGLLVAHLPLR